MENFETAREVVETSANSAGSAMAEHEKWMQSLQARINVLKSTWQSLAQSFMSSDFLKSALDGVVALVDGIDSLINTFGTLPTLIGAFAGGLSLIKNKGIFTFDKDIKSIKLFGDTFSGLANKYSAVSTKIDKYNLLSASSQEKLRTNWANSTTSFGKYISGLNGGKASMSGYISSLIGAKAATIGLQIATMAFNAALTMGISALISWGISKLDEYIVTADELAEKVENVTSKYKEQRQELNKIKSDYDTSNEDSMISKYGELSKGVDSLGKNVSLTADEYAEYRDIVSTIAGQIPGLVTGYNSQGDAILSCAGNVDTLAEAYRNLVIEQDKAVIDTGEDIFKDFKNNINSISKMEGVSATKHLEELDKILSSFNSGTVEFSDGTSYHGNLESWASNLAQADVGKITELLEANGFERNVLFKGEKGFETQREFIIRAIKEDSAAVKEALGDAFDDVNAFAEDLNLFSDAYLDKEFLTNYSHFGEKMQGAISQVASGFDAGFYEQFADIGELENYLDSMLSAFDSLSETQKSKFEAAFDLQTQFNGGEISYGEYVKGIQDAGKLIDGLALDDEVKSQIKLALNTDEVTENYEALKNRLTSDEYNIQMKTDEAEKFLNGLSASEYAVALDLIVNGDIDFSDFDIDSLRDYIEKQAKLNEAINFTISMDIETESLEALNTAMAESVSGAGLSSEAIASLKGRYAELTSQGYDLSSMFEETANGIHLNKRAVDEFEQALASDKLFETKGHLDVLKNRYDELTDEINNCTDAGERANLYSEQQQVAQKINDLATLASQYEGLTSSYKAWQDAESAGNERDMYENVLSGFETVKDELSRGWADDGTVKFLELITGETDLAGKSAKELKEIWNGLDDTIKNTSYSVKDFFTTDKDGNSTSKGVYNFLDAVGQLEEEAFGGKDVVKRDKDGNIISFDFKVAGGDEAIAEALGISEELVQIMLRAADDAGFVVTIDGKWTQLADLKTSAEESGNALKKLRTEGLEELKEFSNEDLTFNFDASSLEELNAEFEKANNVLDKFKDKNGKIKTDKNGNMVDGAKEALEVASYYQATIDKLTEPVYMQLETNQVEENLQKPLTKMQEFERLSKEKHQLKLTGDTDGLKDVEAEMDEIAKYLDNLDEETKIDLEIDGLSQEEIKDKLEKGEIEIPATVDIQLEMSEDIKDMRLLMMNELGLISDEEVKLKVGYEIDDSIVDRLTDEEKEVVIKYIEENEEAWDKLSEEEREVFIELVASGVDLDTLTDDEKKEVVIDFVTKNEDEFNKLTDEEKQVVVDLAVDDNALSALEKHGVEIEAFCNIFGVEKIDDLKAKLDTLTDEQITILAKVLGQIDVEKLKTTVAGLDDKTVQAIAKALGEGDVEGLKTVINGLDDKTVQAIVEAFGYSDVSELNAAIDNLDPKTVQAIAQALGIKDVNSLRDAINRLKGKDVKAAANVKGKKDVDGLKSSINSLKGKTITVWAQIKKKASDLWSKLTGGGGGVDGTAHVSGTAYANGTVIKKSGKSYKQGDWGAKTSGVALGAELGPELLVRNGRWHLIGEDGAQFFGYRKGDIIFNADQTREIFEKGKITHGNGRGKALSSGTAFSSGSGGGFWENESVTVKADKVTVNSNSSPSSSSSSSSSKSETKKETSNKKSSSKEAEEEFEESIDWIEIAIDRLERAIGQLDTKAGSAYRSWEERNSSLVEQIGKTGEEIELQQKAYERYMQEAANVGLSSDWIAKIQNGSIDIETITDEELAEKVEEYRKWYEAALDCKDAILELQEAESELFKQRFDNVATQYEGMLSIIEHEKNMLDEFVNQAEAQGHLISKEYYQALIGNEQKQIAKLQEEKSALLSELQTAMQSGTIAKGSEAWYEMVNAIDEVTLAIAESETAILSYQQTLQQLDWKIFDLLQEQISAITQEAEFLIDLMSNKKLFNDNGSLTDEGMASVGLHGVNYNVYMSLADDAAKEAEKLKAELAKDPYDTELEARYREVIGLQQEHILAAEGEKDAIRDLVEEGINLELEALQDRIDLYNENLDSARDLYDYQKKVKEQTEEIASLEKQIASYKNDDSEETRAKLQELKVALEDAKLELEETEYDKFINDQQKLLDDLYLEYETILNQRLDNIDALVMQMIDEINMSAGSISATIHESADAVGYTLSDSMQTIWNTSTSSINSVITMYGSQFATAQTTTNNALNAIKVNMQTMISQLSKIAAEKVKEAATSSAANSTQANAKPTTTKPTTTEKPKEETKQPTLTDDQLMGIAASIWVDGSKSGWGNDPIRSGKLKEKFNESIAKQVQSLINKHGPNGDLYNFWIKNGKNLKKYHYSAFKYGARNIDESQFAWTQEGRKKEFIVRPSDGAILTPIAKGDSVLNANASRNIWNMANSPAEFIKDTLNIGIANTPNNSNIQNNIVQNFENVTFSMPNVHGYNELLTEMKRDPKFEKFILSMTNDRLAGKSSLAKGKVIR